MKAATKVSPVDLAEIDDFCDALWLDDGLAKTSLASYRSDLMRVAAWAAKHDAGPLIRISPVAPAFSACYRDSVNRIRTLAKEPA